MTDDRTPQMNPAREAAIRSMLLEQVRNASAQKAARRRKQWTVWAGAGILSVGLGATAAAVVLDATKVTNDQIVHCLESDQRAADGSYPGPMASIASEDQRGRVDDAIALCTMMWEQGVFEPGFDPVKATNPPGEVPAAFQVCVMPDGSAAVVPSDEPAICSRLGLAPLED